MHSISSSRRPIGLALAAAAVVLLAACASSPPPNSQMAVAKAAIQHASTSSTSENAADELRIATNKLASARTAMDSKDYDRAGQLAEQAEVDAQVAELHAQSARSGKAAKESQDAARVLREEITRKAVR